MDGNDSTRNVTPMALINGGKREPQLTDAELVAIRRMLGEHAMILAGCPLAQRCTSTR